MNLSPEEILERENLRHRILGRIETLEDVQEIRKQLRSWLRRHPDDSQLLGEGESLVMLESALRLKRKQTG